MASLPGVRHCKNIFRAPPAKAKAEFLRWEWDVPLCDVAQHRRVVEPLAAKGRVTNPVMSSSRTWLAETLGCDCEIGKQIDREITINPCAADPQHMPRQHHHHSPDRCAEDDAGLDRSQIGPPFPRCPGAHFTGVW